MTAIAAGGLDVCAVVAGGALVCWGANDNGQLTRDFATVSVPSPSPIAAP